MKNNLPVITWRHGFVLLFIAYLIFPVAMMLSSLRQASPYVQLIQGLIMLVAIVILFFLTQGRIAKSHLSLQSIEKKHIILWSLVYCIVLQLIVFVWEKRIPGTYVSPLEQFSAIGFGNNTRVNITKIVVIGMLMPFVEELLFRGVLFRVLRDTLSNKAGMKYILAVVVACLVSSFLFMDVHTGFTIPGLIYMIMGVVFVMAYIHTGSLSTAIMIHVLNNVFALGQVLFSSTVSSLPFAGTKYLLFLLPVIAWLSISYVDTVLPVKERE